MANCIGPLGTPCITRNNTTEKEEAGKGRSGRSSIILNSRRRKSPRPLPALFLGPRGSRSTLNAKTQLDVLVRYGLIVQDKVAPKQQLLATNETNHD